MVYIQDCQAFVYSYLLGIYSQLTDNCTDIISSKETSFEPEKVFELLFDIILFISGYYLVSFLYTISGLKQIYFRFLSVIATQLSPT